MKLKSLVILILALIVMGSCATKQKSEEKRNPYNLPLVTAINEYKKHVQENPEMELVDLEKVIPTVVLDIRYATEKNFTGEVIYKAPKAFARKPVAEALKQVQDSLAAHNLGLLIYDAYRPYAATLRFYEVYPDTEFVADPKHGSRHNRGCAIDLSLVDLQTGKEIPMPSEFDDFSKKARPDYDNLSEEVKANRAFLFNIMDRFGFHHISSEWWHFDYNGWKNFPLMDISFTELEK